MRDRPFFDAKVSSLFAVSYESHYSFFFVVVCRNAHRFSALQAQEDLMFRVEGN